MTRFVLATQAEISLSRAVLLKDPEFGRGRQLSGLRPGRKLGRPPINLAFLMSQQRAMGPAWDARRMGFGNEYHFQLLTLEF